MAFTDSLLKNKKVIEDSSDPFVLASSSVANITKIEEREIKQPRASSIYDSCMRMHVLCTILKRKQKVYYSIKDIITFGIGNAVHYWAQNFPDLFGDERYGFWKCGSCEFIKDFGPLPKIKCPKCSANATAWVYHEYGGIVTNPYNFSFHIDMFKKVGDVYRIGEIKTISRDKFYTLAAPLIAHEYQVLTYIMGCFYLKTLPIKLDLWNSYVYYISKEHTQETIPIKAFLVKTNKEVVKNIKDKLRQYKAGITNYPSNIPPKSTDCESKGYKCWRAKKCPVMGECEKL